MLSWFKKKPTREIFKFNIAGIKKQMDPLVVWNRLWFTDGVDFHPLWKRAYNGDSVAQEELHNHLLNVFELPAFNPDTGEGVTAIESHEVMWTLLAFMEGLKKKRGSFQDTLLKSDSKSLEKSTTQPESESSSTENGSENVAPS